MSCLGGLADRLKQQTGVQFATLTASAKTTPEELPTARSGPVDNLPSSDQNATIGRLLLVDNVGIQEVAPSVRRLSYDPGRTLRRVIHSEVAFRSVFRVVLHRLIPMALAPRRRRNMLQF